ncbi:hypothetical protein HG530_003926 [Fusarium avenaceum]|nr:hypothetical protein HG530_003926 [Fusarium avenaceum]
MKEPSPEASGVTDVTGVCAWTLTPAASSSFVRCIKNLKGHMVPAVKLAQATAPLTPQICRWFNINGSGKSKVAIDLLFLNDLLDGAQVRNFKLGNLSTSALTRPIYVGGNMAVKVWPTVSAVAAGSTGADTPGLKDADGRGAEIAD